MKIFCRMLLMVSMLFIFSVTAHSSGLKIYTEDAPPDQFLDKNGKLTGFAVEVVNEIQKRLGTNYPIEVVSWSWAYNILQKEPNTVLFSVTRTAERDPLFQWVGPISEDQFGFYAKKDSKLKIKSLEDAKKVKGIGVYMNDVRAQHLEKAGFKNLDKAYDQISNYKKLAVGRIELLAGSLTSIEDGAKRAGYEAKDFKLLYIFMRAQLYIAFSKSTPPETVKAWDNALNAMKKDGSFKAIFKKYYPNNELPGAAVTNF